MDQDSQKSRNDAERELAAQSKVRRLRVLKLAERMGLASDTLASLKAELLIEEKSSVIPVSSLEESTVSKPPLLGFGAIDECYTATLPLAEPVFSATNPRDMAPAAPSESKTSPRQALSHDLAAEAELRLRQKIEAEQNWNAFRKDAWLLYESYPRSDVAARLCELAFLYGSAAELEDVLMTLLRDAVDFYGALDAEMRLHIVLKLWANQRLTVLDGLLFRKDLQLRLLPLERLYCCWAFLQAGELTRAYRFFRQHDQEIWSAQKTFAGHLKQSESEFAYMMGRAALAEHDEPMALQLLEAIPRYASEFQKALDLLLDIRVERNEQGFCVYGQKLQKEMDWRGRVTLLDSFLLRIQRFEASAPKDRAALNELLKDPFRWFPEQPEAWQALVETLLDYQQLEYLLPNLMGSLKVRATQFFKPVFDHALWFPVSQHEFQDPLRSEYWRGISLLHEFTWTQGEKEELLWRSRQHLLEAEDLAGKNLQPGWPELQHALLHWISKTSRMDENRRKTLLLVVKLMGDAKDVTEADISRYLANVTEPTQEVMHALEQLVRQRGQTDLEAFLLERKCGKLHYTNQDLERMWLLSGTLQRYDQCWRIATIAKNRLVLNSDLERSWVISGEKKREFSLHSLQDSHLKLITQSFEGSDRKLVEALLSVGPMVPELLASLNVKLTPVKKGKGLTSAEEEIHSLLESQTWLPNGKKLFTTHPGGMWHVKPPFFASLLDTKWVLLFMAIAQRCGVTAWDWQLSLLHHQIESLVPRMSRGMEAPTTGKVGRWLRLLSPQQRKSWYELAQLSRRFTDEQAQLVLARLFGKIACSMLQDHTLILQSLDKLRAPLRLRWDMEQWVVSDTYGDLRKSLGSTTVGHFSKDVYELSLLEAR